MSDDEYIIIRSEKAPEPVGAYIHARRVGDLIFLAGIGPRTKDSDFIPIGAEAETEAVIRNVKQVLEDAGSSLEKVVDVQCFLTNMKRDFKAFNEVYAKHFRDIPATRTTVEVTSLPTPINVDFKVIATV